MPVLPSLPTGGAESRRARIVDAMVLAVYEHGFARTTVTMVCARARVSRGTFYEEFAGLRECFLAVMDDGYRRAHRLIDDAFEGAESWRVGLRAALAAVLAFFDTEPVLARVWLVETLAAGAWALERRERHVATLIGTIAERWPVPGDAQRNPLDATAVMESVLGTIRTHVLAGAEEPLIALLGPLMGVVTMPYLGPEAVAREMEHSEQLAQAAVEADAPRAPKHNDCAVEIPSLLEDARAQRARRCLRYVAGHPGASNRQVAGAAGIASDSHISTLLARLYRARLLQKRAKRPGGPNAWTLSRYGHEVLNALEDVGEGLQTAERQTDMCEVLTP